jgi:biopolymer transport protein TolQ
MNGELSVISLVLEASIVVQAVLLLLLIASIASWAVIIEKQRLLKQAIGNADDFEASFWSGGDLAGFTASVSNADETPLGMAGIFESGFREFGRLRKEGGLGSDQIVEGARRSMHVSQIARGGSPRAQPLLPRDRQPNTSPYVGLFGTVWGIMSAFYSLGNLQSATIAVVAPHISEALIATAMGLFAAIPAGIAYNRYADQVGRLEVRYDTFMEELSAILQRSAARKETQGAAA